MAEIDFKRRGTPLWLVVLVLAIVAGGAYLLLARRPEPAAPVAVRADSAAAATTAAPVAAGPTGPSVEFAKFANERRFPRGDAAAQRTFLSDAARRLSGVLQERAPTQGVQIMLLRAIADTISMADTKAERLPDLTQLAFFVFANAYGDDRKGSPPLTNFASLVQPNVAIDNQAKQVQDYLDAVREALKSNEPRTGTSPAAGAAPVAPAPAPAAPGTKQPD